MGEEEALYTWHCLCGDVAYEIKGSPVCTAICHCEECRRFAGCAAHCTGYPASAVEAGCFQFTKGKDSLTCYEYTPGKRRHTCKRCGTWVHNILPNGMHVFPVAALDPVKGPPIKPQMHVFIADKGHTDIPDDGLPRYDGWPPM
ncbi:unnamed protein product [Chrysoparadoxa australica]